MGADLDAALDPDARPTGGEGVPLEGSLFRALDRLVAGLAAPKVAAIVQLDGVEVRDPAFDRALSTQLNRYNEERRASQPRVLIAPRGELRSPIVADPAPRGELRSPIVADPAPRGEPHSQTAATVSLVLDVRSKGNQVSIAAQLATSRYSIEIPRGPPRVIPGRAALLPPLLAIVVALALRRVLLALFVGIYAGAVLAAVGRGVPALPAFAQGLWDVFAVYLRRELLDTFRVEIIGFVVALIAMIGVMSRAGGIKGLVERLLGVARSVRSGLFLTWGMGLVIFFDDYANCMLVGSTMRPLTDRLRVSREKLAYIVDSTAAPIAGVSLLSTWIAFEVSVFSAQLPGVGIAESGYAVFLQALPFRYYCFFTLLFVVAMIASGRDFGPMARAERRARREGQLVAPSGRPPISERLSSMTPAPQMPRDWRLAAAPIALTLTVTWLRIFIDGGGAEVLERQPSSLLTLEVATAILLAGGGPAPLFVGACSGLLFAVFLSGSRAARVAIAAGVAAATIFRGPTAAWLAPWAGDPLGGYLAWGIVFGCVVATVNFVHRLRPLGGPVVNFVRGLWPLRNPRSRPHLSWHEMGRAGAGGAGALGFCVVLLFEAWMIGRVCQDVSTADYLVALLLGALPPELLPLLLFAVACAVSFATGSSWSTMSILLPNIVALAAALGSETQLGSFGMITLSIAAVLDGSIFGDHCSPISDTTVLSSAASGCDHLDHVRTQAPYALATAAVAMICGYLPSTLLSWWSFPMALGSGAIVLVALLVGLGRLSPKNATT